MQDPRPREALELQDAGHQDDLQVLDKPLLTTTTSNHRPNWPTSRPSSLVPGQRGEQNLSIGGET